MGCLGCGDDNLNLGEELETVSTKVIKISNSEVSDFLFENYNHNAFNTAL